MALSLSENLAHAPPINGLYAFVFHPFIYAILGSSPLVVVGPEAAGSLLIGTIVKTSVSQGKVDDDDTAANAVVVGVATAMAGAMVLMAGLTRLGFLDNVLSRPFLRGFITAIGFVILVDQLIPELGLAQLSKYAEVDHGSTATKLAFLAKNIHNSHGLTTAVSFGSFAVIMVFRYVFILSHYNSRSWLTLHSSIQDPEKDAPATLSPSHLLPRPVPFGCPVGRPDMAFLLGPARARDPRLDQER